MVLFREANQVFDLQLCAVIENDVPVVTSEHLVHFARNDDQIRCRGAIFEGRKDEIETIFIVREMPGLHVIAGCVAEFNLVQLVDTSVDDDSVLGCFAQVAKALAKIETNCSAIGQKA